MTSRSTKTKSVMVDRTNTRKRIELTNKRLDLLLPSTRQLMLNSSIKYNTDEEAYETTLSKHQIEQPAPMPKKQGYGKQNEGGYFGAASKGALQRQASTSKLANLGEGPVPQNSQDPNTLLQPLKSIKKPVASHINKPLSAAQLPNYQQANQKNLTSLNNILPNRLDQNKQKEDNPSKEDLLKRVERLEKLVQDIITGKVVIHRKSKSQSKMKVAKPQRTSIKVLEQCSRKCKNRSVTWNAEVDQAGSSKSLKSNKSKSRLRIQSSEQRKMLNIIKIPLINPKGFVIKKKNPLKLASNYQPIREQSQQKSEARNLPKYISPIGQRSSQSNLFSKLKTKVLFTPNLINM